ncbi:MAG: deoxyguanosinetriphosphate triphosphohydrolase [Clostridiales bacterium]|nr:deoxyguanosinetriphosphate triphosphohydrolase [Clostridiales bacterium]
MTPRQYYEAQEAATLSPFASQSGASKGRDRPIKPCDIRTDYQRDRDRIIHCKSFRRLKHKTQVFLSPRGDHYRTRLTHTLEVSQIARTIARALRLNEDLTEAIAMGHDLGHTPFGHAGEEVLNRLVPDGFEHNLQSLRIVEKLENGVGLNLTAEVRDGIKHHKKNGTPMTLEGQVVSLSDRIAYINHDIDDAIRAEVLSPADLPKATTAVLGESHGERINTLIIDVVNTSFMQPAVSMSGGIDAAFNALRDYMFQNVYLDSKAKREEKKAKAVIEQLYAYYLSHFNEIACEFAINAKTDGEERIVADWIACMTDRYAIKTFEKLFVPQEWA